MSESIPVNPDIMRWARETAGYSIEDVVDKVKRKHVTIKVVQDWENGNASPSYPQLENLAYKIFGTSFYSGTVSISDQIVTFFNKNMTNLVAYA